MSPFLVTDHLCFTGTHATNARDLLPLPYTEEAIRTAAAEGLDEEAARNLISFIAQAGLVAGIQ